MKAPTGLSNRKNGCTSEMHPDFSHIAAQRQGAASYLFRDKKNVYKKAREMRIPWN
jgi:hypothetical protein